MEEEYFTIRDELSKDSFKKIDENNKYNFLDALVFSNFVYIPIGSIDVPHYRGREQQIQIKGLTIGQIVAQIDGNINLFNKRFYDNSAQTGEKGMERKNFYDFFMALGKNPRYKDLKVVDYSLGLSSEGDVYQYCNFLIEIKEKEEYVLVSRGTDRTMEGWFEDSKIVYEVTTGQKKTLDFLSATLENYEGVIHLTGHSKGGCNAYYSLIMTAPIHFLRLDLCVFDALFFNQDFALLQKETMELIRDLNIAKFYNIENSFIGEVLFGLEYSQNKDNVKYIKSTSLLPFVEHCLYSYHVTDMDFEYTKRSQKSILLNTKLKKVILEEKERLNTFFHCIFNILGYDTCHSILNPELSNKDKLILVLENFIKTPTESLLVMYELINDLYGEINSIISLENSDGINGLIDGSIDHASEENEKDFKKALDSFLLDKLNLETFEEIEKFKKNSTFILGIINSKENKKTENHGFLPGVFNIFTNKRKYSRIK